VATRTTKTDELIEEYLGLGLAIGRHLDGFVDSYYGPPALAAKVAAAPPVPPDILRDRARRLLAILHADADLDPTRRRWMADQARGLHTTARRLAGEEIAYLDEIEACYGVRPRFLPEDEIAAAHRRLAEALPGPTKLPASTKQPGPTKLPASTKQPGPTKLPASTKQAGPTKLPGPAHSSLAERYIAWREGQAIPPSELATAVESLAEDLRYRTARRFGLPDGEHVDFEFVTSKPWGGFNYYLGGLKSRVAINMDLPVLAPVVGALVAHESYPGHHTEHCRKEAGLVRRQAQLEETIFLVGTPQCLLAEGLADLAWEVIAGPRPEAVVAEHLRPLGVPFDPDIAGEVAAVAEILGAVRGNAAILIHDRGLSPDDAAGYLERWALTTRPRAEKAVQFLMDPTWRAYPFCYIDGVRLCRSYVRGEPARFERLITEQVVPAELVGAGDVP
jgi:hypothetical protein